MIFPSCLCGSKSIKINMSYYLLDGVVSIDDGIVPLATPCCVDCPTIRIWDFPSQQHVGLIQLNYRQLQGDDDFGSMKSRWKHPSMYAMVFKFGKSPLISRRALSSSVFRVQRGWAVSLAGGNERMI